MPFTTYKAIADVLQEFSILYSEADFIQPTAFALSDYMRAELEFNRAEVVIENSEAAICEAFIYPILREVWKQHKDILMLWSHRTVRVDEQLSGQPDYLVAQRSPLGKVILERPCFAVVEAKQDNFATGWGQCAAELVALQRLNDSPDITLFGIVANANRWEFARLQGRQLTKNHTGYNIENLDSVFGAVSYVFEQCAAQAKAAIRPSSD
ncbi:hypothetical protein [Spirulina major]|uniref:hypothetical protein n=1 Tax=Spirulina major TaxID=270636 RepID=UPI00093429D7|nr:hypothetical protein [Spirulina major]